MSNLQKQVNLGQRQQGASSIGLMALLAVIAIFVVGAMRIVPIYLENQTVHRVLEGIANDPRVDARSKLSIMKSINKRLFLNDIRFIKKEHVAIARRKSQTLVTIEYESRRPLFGPFFVGGSFTESVIIAR